MHQLGLLEAAALIKQGIPDAELVIEPKFFRAGLWQLERHPLEVIRSIVFRAIKDGEEIFRADLRQGNRTHLSSLRIFCFDDSHASTAHRLIEHVLGRQISYRDFDRDLVASFSDGENGLAARGIERTDVPRACAPKIDFAPNLIGTARYSYSAPRLDPDLGAFYAQELKLLTDRIFARAAIVPSGKQIGAASEHAVVLMYPEKNALLRPVHGVIDSIRGAFTGRLEKHPPHNLWAGINCPEVTPKVFFRQIRAMKRGVIAYALNCKRFARAFRLRSSFSL